MTKLENLVNLYNQKSSEGKRKLLRDHYDLAKYVGAVDTSVPTIDMSTVRAPVNRANQALINALENFYT